MASVFDEIEQTLVDLYSLPHNKLLFQGKNSSPQAEAKRKLGEIRSGLASVRRDDIVGPALFLRVVGPNNRAFSGEWWFDARLLDTLDAAYSKIYFTASDKREVIRHMLRELLAISEEWNIISEVWALDIPPGQKIIGYSGPGNPQKLFANLPLSAEGNRMLVGKIRQIYFPFKNPLWVKLYQNFST